MDMHNHESNAQDVTRVQPNRLTLAYLLQDRLVRYPQPPEIFDRATIVDIVNAWIAIQMNVDDRTRKHPQPRRSIDSVPASERPALDEKLWCLLDIFVRKALYGRVLPKGTLPKALAVLNINERQAEIRMEQLAEQILDHPSDPKRWGEVLLDSRGRPKGTYTKAKSPEDALAVRLSVSHRQRVHLHRDGTRSVDKLQPGIDIPEDVLEFVEALRPSNLSIDAYRLRIAQLVETNPAYYKLLTEGEAALRRDTVPKMKFQTNGIDEIWQWDACDLPKYMNHNDQVCTATWLRFIEAETDFHLHNRMIPKIDTDESGNIFPISFGLDDAAVFLIETMRKHNRRPRFLHNDHGSNILGLKDRLPLLTEPGETPIEMLAARPEEPWGKGLTETGFGKRLWRVLSRGGGYYSKRERASYRKVDKNPKTLSPSSTVAADLNGFCDDLNTLPRIQEKPGKRDTTQPSRNDLYAAYVSPLPCPPIRRLYHLLSDARRREQWVHLDHQGFDFAEGGEKHWIPIPTKREELPAVYLRWMNADLANQACHFFAIKLTDGWIGEVCLGGIWYEVVPRSQFPYTDETHKWAHDEAIGGLKRQIDEDFARDMAKAETIFGALPEQLVATVRGHYQMPPNANGTTQTAPPPSENTPANGANKATPNPAKKRSQNAKAASGIDWSTAFRTKSKE